MTKRLMVSLIAFSLIVIASSGEAFAGGQFREIPMEVTVIAEGGQCEPTSDGWRATWIASSDALEAAMKRCRSHRIGAPSDNLPHVDFNRFGVLAVEMGRRSSAGYGFETDKMTARRTGKTVTVTLPYMQPAPDAMTAMVMTAPWILIRIPLESFNEIRVVDQAGALLDRIDLP
jgi:hypothetical protein